MPSLWQLLPAPIAYSHRLLDVMQKIRKDGDIPYLRPDSKSQVSIQYNEGKPVSVDTVVISHQTDDVSLDQIREDLIKTDGMSACTRISKPGAVNLQLII